MLRRLDLRGVPGDHHELARVLPRPPAGGDEPAVLEAVRTIIADVRARGDEALRELTERFDRVRIDDVRVPPEEVKAAPERVAPALRTALEAAHDSIVAYHRAQVHEPATHERAGVTVRELRRPVDRAGLYVPGGRARYPSTVLMTAVPARVAGVRELALCVPPGSDGAVPDEVLAGAAIAGVDEVYRVGGAQAIAALAYGTASIRPVDVIVGPGNVYVAVAKREVAGVVGVPSSFAGPSEVVVVADDTVPVDWAAIDVIVQAEHGPDGLAWLVTWDEAVADAVTDRIAALVAESPRRADVEATLSEGGYAVICDGPDQAVAVANAIAPEHLELLVADPEALLPGVRHAGAVFCGPWAPASVGDYIAGPNHVLPTHGTARFAEALRVDDFVKHIHVVGLGADALAGLGEHVVALADAEGLHAHAESIRLRRQGGPGDGRPTAPGTGPAGMAERARPAVRDDLRSLEGYHSPQVEVAVRLNTNEAPEAPPPAWRDELLAELATVDFNRYPDRAATALRQAIADHEGVEPAQVLAANGSNEVIQAVCLAYGGPGRTAAVFEPTYRLHAHIASVTGTAVVEGRRSDDLRLDLDEVRGVLGAHEPAITFVCSPNNPTGMLEEPDAVRAVADLAPGVVVVDEAYGQFAPWSALELVGEDRPLVVTRTYSKTWSMAALRLGYLVGPSWLVAALEAVVLPYHLDVAQQIAGRLALRHRAEMEARVAALVEQRGRLAAALGDLPVDTWPSAANFILFRPRERSGDDVWQGLLDRSVLVRNCASWPGLEGCLRVTVGTPAENDAFLTALTEVLT